MDTVPTLGIDFGTTNSVCAIRTPHSVEVLRNQEGDRLTPSAVYYTKDDERERPLVGKEALNKAESDPDRVVKSVKRSLGDRETITIDGEEYVVEEVAADIIRKIRNDAARVLGVDRDDLTEAVITTPAYWESDRSKAVEQAARIAGFEHIRLIREPAAAGIAYGWMQPNIQKTIGVYDLGGGTFDFAIVEVDNSTQEYKVVAQAGDANLGGDDWDAAVASWIRSNIISEYGVDPYETQPTEDKTERLIREERIRQNAKQAKERLSQDGVTEVDIRIPFLMQAHGDVISASYTLQQKKFEELTADLLKQTTEPMRQALNDVGYRYEDLDDVILVGGSTRMPQVQELWKSRIGKQPRTDINQDEVVARGAAIKAKQDDVLLLEVTPLTLGIGLEHDQFKPMIERNERLPAKRTELFTTASNDATAVRIPIYQGERDIASENRHLKTLVIKDMTPGKQSSPHIEVTFEVQRNGLIRVEATESTKSQTVEVEIEDANRLTDEFIEERVQEAREMEQRDEKRRRILEAKSSAKQAIEDGKQLLSQYQHTIESDLSKEDVDRFDRKIREVQTTLNDDTATVGELRRVTEELNKWILEIGDVIRESGGRADTELPSPPAEDDLDVPEHTASPQPQGNVASQDTTQQTSTDTQPTTTTQQSVAENTKGPEPATVEPDFSPVAEETPDEESESHHEESSDSTSLEVSTTTDKSTTTTETPTTDDTEGASEQDHSEEVTSGDDEEHPVTQADQQQVQPVIDDTEPAGSDEDDIIDVPAEGNSPSDSESPEKLPEPDMENQQQSLDSEDDSDHKAEDNEQHEETTEATGTGLLLSDNDDTDKGDKENEQPTEESSDTGKEDSPDKSEEGLFTEVKEETDAIDAGGLSIDGGESSFNKSDNNESESDS